MNNLIIPDKTDLNSVKAILHLGDHTNAVNHLVYWLSTFKDSGVNILVVVRNLSAYNKILALDPETPVAYAKSPLDIESLVHKITNLAIILFTTNTGNNVHLLRFNEYKHIYIGSEHSERVSQLTKYRRAYDTIWVSGDEEEQKYLQAEIGKFDIKKIGSPQLAPYFKQSTTRNPSSKIIIHYSVNYPSSKSSSINLSGEILYFLEKLACEITVNISTKNPNPQILETNFEDLSSNLGNPIDLHFNREISPELASCDLNIIDIECITKEILATKKPLLVYVSPNFTISSQNLEYYSDYNFCYLFSNLEEFHNSFDEFIKHDSLQSVRSHKIDSLFGESYTQSNQFVEQLKQEKLI